MAPFIKHMLCDVDRTESLRDMQARVAMELIVHLGDGPYFGGLDRPSLVDLAIFPQLAFEFMVGITDNLAAAGHPAISAWLSRMKQHLPDNPLLVPDNMIVNKLPDLIVDQEKVA